MRLYHACSRTNVDAILSTVLKAPCYLTNDLEVATYYAEGIADEGGEPVILELELDELLASVGEDALSADRPSIAEPPTLALRTTGQAVAETWGARRGTWRDSLDIVHSLQVRTPIPGSILREADVTLAATP